MEEQRKVSWIEEAKPLAINRKNAIIRAQINFPKGPVAGVVKCARPELYPEFEALEQDAPPVVIEGGYKRSRLFHFQKESRIMEALSLRLDKQLSPRFYGTRPAELKFAMERFEGQFFKDVFLDFAERGEDPNYYRERLLQHIGHFRREVNDEDVRKTLLALKYRDREGIKRPLVGFRSWNDQVARFHLYTRLLPLTHSGEFKERYHLDQWEYSKPSWNKMKRNINTFYRGKKIDFHEFANRALSRHTRILYGDKDPYRKRADLEALIKSGDVVLVHGDSGPQNIGYLQNNMGIFIDFNEMCLANEHTDVVAALYHVTTNPSESQNLTLLRNYLREEQGPRVDLATYLPQVLETRLMENYRWIASDARKSRSELLHFAGLVSKPRASTETLRSYNLNRFLEFSEFYLRGEGNYALTHNPTEKGNLFLEQLADFEGVLREVTGLVPSFAKKYMLYTDGVENGETT
jgi:hypothetical protein